MTEKPDQINPVLLEIGKIIKPHGLNGELIVFLSTKILRFVFNPFFESTVTFIIFWWARRDSNS